MGGKEMTKRNAFVRLLPVIVLIILNLLIGALTFRDYGESRDEPGLMEYADQSLGAYKNWSTPSYKLESGGGNLPNYGPAFVMGVALTVWLTGTSSPIEIINIWHLAYFIVFQIAVFCIYLLGRRWMSDWAAFGAALLFSTQPLLWGQAFINPKDIPLMAFFLASVVSGLWMCDQAIEPWRRVILEPIVLKPLLARSTQNWRGMSLHSKRAVGITFLVWAATTLLLLLGQGMINGWIAALVLKGHSADPQSLIGHLFLRLAQHADTVTVEKYIYKAQNLFASIRDDAILLGGILILWLLHPVFPWSIRLPAKGEVLSFLQQFARSFTQPAVIIAGVVLGLTASIRISAPLAGLIIGLYALWGKGRKSIAPLLAYTILALGVMVLTWPYLWSGPITHLAESVKTMSTFPWLGDVLFSGKYYQPNALPFAFLPVLLSIQFTEPVVVLGLVGGILAIHGLVRHKRFELFGITLIWFILPITLIIITRRPMYDNFRQLLFLLPPIFLLCGIALESVFQLVRKGIFKVILLILLVLPAIYADFYLHPYEYIYYNSFAGGVDGAFRKFETDYWMTSYRKAAEFLNTIAPKNARILVWEGYRLVEDYTRPDLLVEPETGNTYDLRGGYNYVVSSSRHGNDAIYPSESPILTIRRGKAILTVVKHLSPSASP